MCVTCGCGDPANVRIEGEPAAGPAGVAPVGHSGPDHDDHGHGHDHDHDHDHDHGHDHGHGHGHDHGHDHGHGQGQGRHSHVHHGHGPAHAARGGDAPAERVALETALLSKNQRVADRNRDAFARSGIVALNLMSSPGSGKTTLLVRTLRDLAGELAMSVVEGDQETSADADRIRATGASAVQINTGAGCHLEADMLERALLQLAPPAHSVLFIENVGNLVCPALFDLGEKARVVVLSVTEGDDKPLKYPHMFRSAQLMVTTKMDLAPYVSFDVARAERNARSVNPTIRCLRVSGTRGDGLQDWYGWLRAMVRLEALA